ncbi:glycoside hydrolase family 88/105 protein [Occallatibacter riparius]|uniref:Glycoside hydrolase family 88 protein n=1 Tax=Occallatibacter riparius TaxID=1002689 RepID=A0A9J7BP38_9BACT|nr:glycoside hydrolase family 88 protein [Occallatibacter riparius]UWZ84480.1 glycoside hydrolase family 88 protein [Occallatibacter riparius]
MNGRILSACLCLSAFTCAAALAQQAGVPDLSKRQTAAPGDAPADAGPLASDLSPAMTKRDIAKAVQRVADWQLQRLPAEAQYDWTFAALYAGMMAVPTDVSGDKYRTAMRRIGDELAWQPGPRILHADDQAVSQMYLEQYMLTKDERMLAPTRTRMDAEISTADDGTKPLWWWCDALFMAPPVLADLAAITHDDKYWQFMDHQWHITDNLLYDKDEHLFSRDLTFMDKRERNGRRIFWSRGNGWVMAGLVRVIDRMPADSPLRAKYVARLQQMAAAVIKVQGADGLWRPGLLDPDSYPLPEISGSAFITYALAYGVNHKLLPAATYSPVIHKAWAGMLKHIFADGRLGCIQPVGAAPAPLSQTSSYVYGVGAFLIAGSEMYSTAR